MSVGRRAARYGPGHDGLMGPSIDGGWSEAADTPLERGSEREDGPERDVHEENERYAQVIEEKQARDAALVVSEIDDEEVTDDPRVEAFPEDLSPLSEIECRSIADSAKAFVEFAKRRLLSVAADHVLPVVGGRAVDLTFEVLDVVASVRALGSDEPVLEVPLPPSVPGLDLSVEIPLANGTDDQTITPLAFCIGPDSPSLTGGWALDANEDNDPQAQQPPADEMEAALERLYAQQEPVARPLETDRAAQPGPRVRSRSGIACLAEIDLDSLRLPRHRKVRAWGLAVLAAEYAPQLRDDPALERFEVFVITDRGRCCGLWIWRSASIETGRLVL
jgi:hypothetical protein